MKGQQVRSRFGIALFLSPTRLGRKAVENHTKFEAVLRNWFCKRTILVSTCRGEGGSYIKRMHTREFSAFPISSTRTKAIALMLCAVCLLMTGCNSSSSVPGESEGRQTVEEQVKDESRGLMKLVSFEKTNGQAFDVLGVKGYSMEYKVVVEFLDDGKWLSDFRGTRGTGPGLGKPTKKGERVTIEGVLRFEKTERGWRVVKE